MCIRQDKRAPVPGRLLGGSDTPAVIEKINKSFMNGEVWGPIGVWKDQMVRVGCVWDKWLGSRQLVGGSRAQTV